ncbi:MAG: zinc-ribbon domain-containing protein [Terriglobales bacterium]
MSEIRRTIVICPKCGEDNSDNFRFCGMCGTLLEARPEARKPAGAPLPNLPPIARPVQPQPPREVENIARPAHKPVSISGPSMLGLNQPVATQPIPSQPRQPTMDSLREKSFSGLDSFFEPEEPKTGGRRILLLLVLLAALAGSSWWLYTNYLSPAEERRKEPVTASSTEAPAEKPPAQPTTQNTSPAPDAGSSQAGSTTASAPAASPQDTNTAPEPTAKSPDVHPQPETKPAIPQTTPTPKIAVGKREARNEIPAKREPRAPSTKTAKLPEPAAADTGDADFRKGEAYLYGRGMPENCDAAMKYLRAASAKSNAKARSMLGTMYDTGHCVARDLPTSYLWFAQALRADPNNQILEKDLSAVWNQMTPPERQLATRMKQ